MGWKRTINISREDAINAIIDVITTTDFNRLTSEELKDIMYGLNIGDDTNLPYYGNNFNIID